MSAIAGALAIRAPRSTPRGHWPIESLWQAPPPGGAAIRGGALPASLKARFDGYLEIPLDPEGPTIIANFVSTLDGVVALDRAGGTGGREISGGFEPDRFVMGLLRATADAVLVGAGTVRASHSRSWAPAGVHPPSAEAFAEWRRRLSLDPSGPTTIIVSGSGRLGPGSLGGADGEPVIVVSTESGAGQLRSSWERDGIEIVALAGEDRVAIGALLGFLRDRGFRLVLSEAGPTLFGALLAANAVDELFLTLAPQLAGRTTDHERQALVEGTAFAPSFAPWARLQAVMRSADHVFLRYDLRADRKGVS
jgi:riboflavin biosynthesis pyrimidine reductase